ncbi:MAG: threonine synthase, partial [Rhodospirillaceae bacterium]
ALKLGAPERKVAFAVPTGNFGNVFAGYVAGRMGLPIDQFVVGSNANDILTRFFASGAMEMTEVMPTISPSMDIQVSSNFERLLFELYGRDGKRVAETLGAFRAGGRFEVPADILAKAKRQFDGARFDDDATLALIGAEYTRSRHLLDPHSAVGLAAARARRQDTSVPMVVLATAHPAKFPDAVEQASGVRPALPPHLADLMTRDERVNVLANDLDALRAFIVERISR